MKKNYMSEATIVTLAPKAASLGWTEQDLKEALSLREETTEDGIIALDREPEEEETAEEVSHFLATAEALGARVDYYPGYHEMILDICDVKFAHSALDEDYDTIDSYAVDEMVDCITMMMQDNYKYRATPIFITRIKAAIAAYYGVASQIRNLAV